MPYTLALNVDIGDYTKASDYDDLSDNVDYLQALADVGHDFDVSTGTGYHRALWSAPIIYKVGASLYFSEWIDDTDPSILVRRMKTGTTGANCKPSSITDATYGVQLYTPMALAP